MLPLFMALQTALSVAKGPSENAADSILAMFDNAAIVAVTEQHRARQIHEFLHVLMGRPHFATTVNDIIVEFGNARYQSVIDRYVEGDSVPTDSLSMVWRNTTQWLVWDSPLYESFFRKVRDLNRNLPPARRVRVVLGDPPIEWRAVRTAEDYRRFAERDSTFASIVEREVLSKHRRGLVIMGGAHLTRTDPARTPSATRRPGVGEILSRKASGDYAVVFALPAIPGIADSVDMSAARPFKRATGTIGGRTFGTVMPKGLMVRRRVEGELKWVPMSYDSLPPIRAVVDALLYLGPESTQVDPDPAIYREPAYQAELRRRAPILQEVYGMDFLSELERLLEQ